MKHRCYWIKELKDIETTITETKAIAVGGGLPGAKSGSGAGSDQRPPRSLNYLGQRLAKNNGQSLFC
jgi:hypothetical protein